MSALVSQRFLWMSAVDSKVAAAVPSDKSAAVEVVSVDCKSIGLEAVPAVKLSVSAAAKYAVSKTLREELTELVKARLAHLPVVEAQRAAEKKWKEDQTANSARVPGRLYLIVTDVETVNKEVTNPPPPFSQIPTVVLCSQ
jgi:hypothetical protein